MSVVMGKREIAVNHYEEVAAVVQAECDLCGERTNRVGKDGVEWGHTAHESFRSMLRYEHHVEKVDDTRTGQMWAYAIDVCPKCMSNKVLPLVAKEFGVKVREEKRLVQPFDRRFPKGREE